MILGLLNLRFESAPTSKKVAPVIIRKRLALFGTVLDAAAQSAGGSRRTLNLIAITSAL